MIDLRKLIEAVEAGDLSATNNSLGVMYSELGNHWPWDSLNKVNSAFRGSLDDAIALCEALLPGWDWSMHGNGQATLWPPGTIDEQNKGAIEADMERQPARALLLAVLRAKLMEMVRHE